jgi:hypothetical protein
MSEEPAVYITATDTQRKIYKAIYLILRKYHALYGLELFVFSGGHGAGYISFQLACERICNAQRLDNHYPSPPLRQPTAFTTYLTHFGIPARATANDEQVDIPPGKLRRTNDVVTWLESQFDLHTLFEAYREPITDWRRQYTVEASEQYLLMVHLAGLLARDRGSYPCAPAQCFSDYDSQPPERIQAIERAMGGLSGRHQILGHSDCFIGSNGKALLHESQVVDVWTPFIQGQSTEQIVTNLLRRPGPGT